jgi:NADH-quinone oxidoreductase subunit M
MQALVPGAFALLLLLPWLNAEVAGRSTDNQSARARSVWGTSLALLVASFLCAAFYTSNLPALTTSVPLSATHALHFTIDNLNAPLLVLLNGLTLALVLGAPTAQLEPQRLRALLRLEALTLLTLSSADLLLLGLGYCLVLVPARRSGASKRARPDRVALDRMFKLYQWLGLGCFLAALGLLTAALGPSSLINGSLKIDTQALSPALEATVFGLLISAAFARIGLFPVHSWLPASLEHGSLLSVAFLVSMRTGLYMLARFVIPAFPELTESAMPWLTSLALCSALYGAVAGLGQHDLRRMVGFLIVSQSGIMLVGLVLGDAHAAAGTLLYWLGFTVATMGLILMIAALRARTGTSDMRELGGVVRRVPQLSAHFFLFGLATIAVPGTLAFAAEDMLIHGALEAHPLLTIVMVLAMVLNAVTVVKAFAHTFLGQPAHNSPLRGALHDLLPRERVASIALLVALICGGFYPQLLLQAQSPAAHRLAAIHAGAHATR